MTERVLMRGNEVIGEAAVRAGCRLYFGYPITPQSELPHYLSRRLPEVGGVFLQAESEIAAISMVYGAAGAGARVMTSSSSPGISLKQEGISYIAGAELPCVIVNMARGGPGLGTIQAAQADYFQSVKGGGHGDYHLLVLAPASVQEMADLTMRAFDLADEYRNPVLILGDGLLGQMMEPVQLPEPGWRKVDKPWATTGRQGRAKNVINSLILDPEELEKHIWHLQDKYRQMAERDTLFEAYRLEDARVVVVAYGIAARVARSAVDRAREVGVSAGLLRPITLFPFPSRELERLADQVEAFLAVEMSAGQMVEDVRLAVNGRVPVHFYGRAGGVVPQPQELGNLLAGLTRHREVKG